MAHRIGGRKLSRKGGPRLALFKNLTVSVLRYERIQTTEAKAKEAQGRVEHMITLAKRGDLTARRAVVAAFPNEPLVVIPQSVSELTGPVYPYGRIGEVDNDLTRQHGGQPIGERMILEGRVLDEDGRPLPERRRLRREGLPRHERHVRELDFVSAAVNRGSTSGH